jgi:hypothetical protein
MQRRVFITLLGAAGLATVLPGEQFTRTAVYFPARGEPVWKSFRAADSNDAQDMALDWLRTKYAHRNDRIEVHNNGGAGGMYA